MSFGNLTSSGKVEMNEFFPKGTPSLNQIDLAPPSDEETIREIVERRLLRAPSEVKAFLPPVLSEPKVRWVLKKKESYLLIVFLSESDHERVQELIAQGYDPFPDLIAPPAEETAFIRVEDKRNLQIEDNSFKDGYAVSVGKDVTAVLVNNLLSVATKELGQYEYKISLAYLVSYGDQINTATWDDYLENLIAYSVSKWRASQCPTVQQ